jgi:hypothetical protein
MSARFTETYFGSPAPIPPAMPRSFGRRRYSGIWPPSNPGRTPDPDLDFCPRIPNPQLAPCPAAIPRPFLLFLCLEPGCGDKLFSRNLPSSLLTSFCCSSTTAPLRFAMTIPWALVFLLPTPRVVGIADANSLFPLAEREETPAKNTERRLSTSGLTLQVAVEAIDAMGKQDADIATIPTTLDQSRDFSLSLRVNFDAMQRSARLPSLHCWLLVWISRRITPADQGLCFLLCPQKRNRVASNKCLYTCP